MKNQNNEQKEYEEFIKKFIKKFIKTGKEINDEINKLSPKNLKRFKSELKNILPISFARLFEIVNN